MKKHTEQKPYDAVKAVCGGKRTAANVYIKAEEKEQISHLHIKVYFEKLKRNQKRIAN